MICFVELSYVSAIVVVIMIAREFMVTSLRLVAAAGKRYGDCSWNFGED